MEKKDEAIEQNLKPMSVIMLNLWAKNGGEKDHYGNCSFTIDEIGTSNKEDIASPFKGDKYEYYSTRVKESSKTLKSTSHKEQIKLKFKCYFLRPLPESISLS